MLFCLQISEFLYYHFDDDFRKILTCSFLDYSTLLCICYGFLFKLLSVKSGELKLCKVQTVTHIVYTSSELKSLRYNNRLDENVCHKLKLQGIKNATVVKGLEGER